MAKQTFSVGQVLTAAQMTSLQQTAMLGGSATAKTASYTLVAADAGTVVSVNSTSATTITVNTGLFSAGDTVTIQNWGSGAVTITAGTATVNTAGSLIVPQYDGGVLYFTSASAAIYFDFVQAGAVSPLTTKGDLYTFSTSDARLPVGTNGYTLVADSAEATGLKWAAPAAGGMTSLATGSLNSLSTLDLTSISQSYIHLQLILLDWELSADSNVYLRINNESQNYYFESGVRGTNTSGGTTTTAFFTKNTDSLVYLTGGQADAGNYRNSTIVNIYNYTQTVFAFGDIKSQSRLASGDDEVFNAQWSYDRTTNNAPITEVNLLLDTGNFSNGTYVLYGVK